MGDDKLDMIKKHLGSTDLTNKDAVEIALGQIESDEDCKELADTIKSWIKM